MAPANRRGLLHQFRGFFNATIIMFSIPGLFATIVQAGGYPALSLALAHYPFHTDNITMAQVAAWFVQRGIFSGSPDVLLLESFARAHRNAKTGNPNLENRDWGEAPRNIQEAIAMSPVPTWPNLVHAPPNVPTEHSRRPSDNGIASSSHAPMDLREGSENGELRRPPPPPSTGDGNIDADDPAAAGAAVSGASG
ncbi:hypothetical protein B0H13DRAFT_2355208 [Mycena leptocephala]|nr:hypothetical protein B0H13DRAFT_2355208 [Mycena leptocephala]